MVFTGTFWNPVVLPPDSGEATKTVRRTAVGATDVVELPAFVGVYGGGTLKRRRITKPCM